MKRCIGSFLALLCVLAAGSVSAQQVPPRATAFATAPDIPYESVPNFLKLPPNLYLGEGIGVARNSKGQIYVFTRSGATWAEEQKLTVARARRIQRFLSQPFFVAEQFTGLQGKYVPVAETVRGFQEIAEGKHDALPEQAFYMVGTIEEAVEKAEKIRASHS